MWWINAGHMTIEIHHYRNKVPISCTIESYCSAIVIIGKLVIWLHQNLYTF